MAFKLNGKPLPVDVAFTVDDINYPANWLRLSTADEKAALENSRKKQVTEIDDTTMLVYNKVISARSGIAVVPLSGNSCGGCGAALPLQMVSEIRSGDLHNCQSCGRFVYNKKN